MCKLTFTSVLNGAYHDALERIFYHNEQQQKLADAILKAVERYGVPRITNKNGQLRILFDSGLEPQTLFAMEEGRDGMELVGVIVYTREIDALVVAFIAIREDYTCHEARGDRMLAQRFFDELRGIGRRVKGIKSIRVWLRGPAPVSIPVSSAKDRT